MASAAAVAQYPGKACSAVINIKQRWRKYRREKRAAGVMAAKSQWRPNGGEWRSIEENGGSKYVGICRRRNRQPASEEAENRKRQLVKK